MYSDEAAAALYDVLNPWAPSDDLYLALVMEAKSVLDVGCGTGALLHRPGGPGMPDGCVGWTRTVRGWAWHGAAPTSCGWPARRRR